MKSIQSCSITVSLLILNPTLAQQNTYPPTSSQTSLASGVALHTISPTAGVPRFPRPTPPPGAETYWPTTDEAFVGYDMQVVAVAGSPVPTVVRMGGDSVSMESTEADADGAASGESDVAPAPAASEDVPSTNGGVYCGDAIIKTIVLGALVWLGGV
jgi:hypothetical protein